MKVPYNTEIANGKQLHNIPKSYKTFTGFGADLQMIFDNLQQVVNKSSMNLLFAKSAGLRLTIESNPD